MDEDLLPIRLPDKIQKPKWAKLIKAHGKASVRSLTGPEAAERDTDQIGKGGRERKRTSKGATAKAEGWLPGPSPEASRYL